MDGCANCMGPIRQTVDMVCPDCGKDFLGRSANHWRELVLSEQRRADDLSARLAEAEAGYDAQVQHGREHYERAEYFRKRAEAVEAQRDDALRAASGYRQRAEKAEAALARVRALVDKCASSSCVHLNTLYADLRAALEDS